MWINLLLAILTVFLILLVHVNLTSIMSHRKNKENTPKPAMLLFTSALIGIGLMLSGLYFSGYLFVY